MAVTKGVADLRGVLGAGRIAQVDSGWESYPGEHDTPADFADDAALGPVARESRHGECGSVGTHRLILLLPPGETVTLSERCSRSPICVSWGLLS
ncbi:MAG: hypothetical protein LBK59_11105 [Bifidobacteriaceae bacterium]|jgi:hypothetical protein|nr:hypothetical protein [Bifidobacteriaceae bacterium]